MLGGRYRIAGRIGEGGTSEVYLAHDLESGTPVVIKRLSRRCVQNAELRNRFLQELAAISRVDHPGVVKVLDYAAPEDEQPYLVMEALVGETLGSLFSRVPKLPTDVALLLCRHAARALHAAHAAGVVHRDVKPGNLFLLGPLGDPMGLKVIDFGMAKLSGRTGTTGNHTILGTVEYMAPEQVMADPADARTDIYGLGIVMFRMFTGHLPFEAKEGLDLLSHQLFSPIPPPSWIEEELDPQIEALILRATRKHPDNRFSTMQELLEALDAIIGFSRPSQTALPPALVVDPDVYEPQNASGREAARMMADRYQIIAPACYMNPDEDDSVFALLRPRNQA